MFRIRESPVTWRLSISAITVPGQTSMISIRSTRAGQPTRPIRRRRNSLRRSRRAPATSCGGPSRHWRRSDGPTAGQPRSTNAQDAQVRQTPENVTQRDVTHLCVGHHQHLQTRHGFFRRVEAAVRHTIDFVTALLPTKWN